MAWGDANPTGAEVLYKKALLRELAQPMSMGAVPDLSASAAEFSAGRAKADAEARALASDRTFTEKRLVEDAREWENKMTQARDYLKIWEDQNQWATIIGGANLVVSGLAGLKQAERVEKQDARLAEIAAGPSRAVQDLTQELRRQQGQINTRRTDAIPAETRGGPVAEAPASTPQPLTLRDLVRWYH
jgi:hypothetical protein